MKFCLFPTARVKAWGGAFTIVSAMLSGQAAATPINGSDTFLGGKVRVQGGVGDLLSATTISLGNQAYSIADEGATGDFSNIAVVGSTPFGSYGSTITGAALNLSSLGSYSFMSSDGNFVAAPSIVVDANTYSSEMVASSGSLAAGSESLSVYLVGTFTPSGSLSAFDVNNASETLSFTETGIVHGGAGGYGSFSVSATFAAPAVAPPSTPTPEPESMMLLGTGLVSLGMVRGRRK